MPGATSTDTIRLMNSPTRQPVQMECPSTGAACGAWPQREIWRPGECVVQRKRRNTLLPLQRDRGVTLCGLRHEFSVSFQAPE